MPSQVEMLQDGHLVVASEFLEQSVSQRTTMTTAVNKYMTSTNTVYIIPHITTAWNVQLRKNRKCIPIQYTNMDE